MDGGPGRNISASFDRIPLRFRPGIIDIGEGEAVFEGLIPDGGHARGDGDRGKRGAALEGRIPDGGHALGDGDRSQRGTA